MSFKQKSKLEVIHGKNGKYKVRGIYNNYNIIFKLLHSRYRAHERERERAGKADGKPKRKGKNDTLMVARDAELSIHMTEIHVSRKCPHTLLFKTVFQDGEVTIQERG